MKKPIEILPDPVIEYYKQFVDRKAIRENLKLTVEERFNRLMERQKLHDELKSKEIVFAAIDEEHSMADSAHTCPLGVWSPQAEEVIHRILEASSPPNWVAPLQERFDALFVTAFLDSVWLIRSTGEVIHVEMDPAEEAITFHVDRVSQLCMLTILCRQFADCAELRELLPLRSIDAVDCECLQVPRLFGPGKIVCPRCGGLGWLPAE